MAEQTKDLLTPEDLFTIIYNLWAKWAESLLTRSKEDADEEKEIMKRFMTLEGIKNEKAPACLMFSAFIGGINQGMEFMEGFTQPADAEGATEKENPASGQS